MQKLRGLVAQGMSGRKPGSALSLSDLPIVAATGSGVATASWDCWALIYAWGPGGSGGSGSGNSGAPGGGGGGALFKRLRLSRGQTISYSVGTPGAGATTDTPGNSATDTTVTLPTGVVLTAGGGKGGPLTLGTASGLGGASVGGDLNRTGSDGGSYSGTRAGGNGAGFADLVSSFGGGLGSAGGTTVAGSAPGGGSGGIAVAGTTGAGGAGKIIIVLVRAA